MSQMIRHECRALRPGGQPLGVKRLIVLHDLRTCPVLVHRREALADKFLSYKLESAATPRSTMAMVISGNSFPGRTRLVPAHVEDAMVGQPPNRPAYQSRSIRNMSLLRLALKTSRSSILSTPAIRHSSRTVITGLKRQVRIISRYS